MHRHHFVNKINSLVYILIDKDEMSFGVLKTTHHALADIDDYKHQ